MQARYPAAIALLMLASLQCLAEEADKGDVPSMEMLEFLGRWETANGKWVDPTRMNELNQESTKQAKQSAQGERDEK